MKQACTGVDFVYLILPSFVQGAEVTMFDHFLQAARATGVKHVVYMSSMDADPSTGFKTFHSNYEREQALLGSEIPATILRPTWFHENAVLNCAESVRRTGQFHSSAGHGVWTSVAVFDIAAAAVALLSDPKPHAGKVYTLTTEAVTEKELAEKMGKVAGRTVTHVNLTPEEHFDLLKRVYPGSASGADEFAHAIVTLDEGKRGSLFNEVHPDLEQLLGRKGVSLDDFLAQHADAFKTQMKS